MILASASPRRRELLKLIGIEHDVRPAHADEAMLRGETPRDHAERLARAKAEAVSSFAGADDVVVGADTIVVIDEKVLGKPSDEAQAAEMLATLSGRAHTVITAVAVRRKGRTFSSVEEVAVTFRSLTAGEIQAYIATKEPMDKAGAYGIQGYGATIVERIDGDFFAVMGLPIVRLIRLLEQAGVRYGFGGLEG